VTEGIDRRKTISARFSGRIGSFALNIELEIPGHGVTALFGASGCGKTSALRCIAGLEKISGGYLRVGEEIWQDEQRFKAPHERAVGYVFQEASLFPHLDVRGNLEFGWRRTPAAERRLNPAEAIELLGLSELLARAPQALSGGQRQRVAIARALLAAPKLLLMDEPMAGLDAGSKADILPWLEKLTRQLDMPVIYVSHSAAEVQRFADHLVLMEDGRAIASGPLNELLTRPDLPLAHLDEAGAVVHAEVVHHDTEFHLTFVEVAGVRFAVSLRDLAVGQRVRIRILARDVSLALQPPQQSSITNVLPVRVLDIGPDRDAAQALIRLDLQGRLLLARITRRSVAMLGLAPGLELYAQVKSVALMD
jgi:molybdate transport system ATP-binding protein